MGTNKLTPPKTEKSVEAVEEIKTVEKIETSDVGVKDVPDAVETQEKANEGISNTKQGMLLKASTNYEPTRRDDRLKDFEESQKKVQEKIDNMNNNIATEEKIKLAKVNETLAKRGFDKVDTFNSIEKSRSVKIIQTTSKETKSKTVIRSKVEMKNLTDSDSE